MLKKVAARHGCDGCYYYEHDKECPVDEQIAKQPQEEQIAWIREHYEEWDCCRENYIWIEESE